MTGKIPETNRAGVYQFVDLDDQVAYVGESSRLRGRLREHVKQFTSTIAGQRRLDYWEIKSIRWWYVPEPQEYPDGDPREDGEQQLLHTSQNTPYLNMGTGEAIDGPIDPATSDGVLELLSEDEIQERSNPYNRARRKLTFLSELVDYLQWADGEEKVHATLPHHIDVLQRSLNQLADEDMDSHRFYRYNE